MQRVGDTPLPEEGAFLMPVAHEGNAQFSFEEISATRAIIEEFLRDTWTDRDGTMRAMRESGITAVKFQGQEAPVRLVSMTASSAEETPRGMEFLLAKSDQVGVLARQGAGSRVWQLPTEGSKVRDDRANVTRETYCLMPAWSPA